MALLPFTCLVVVTTGMNRLLSSRNLSQCRASAIDCGRHSWQRYHGQSATLRSRLEVSLANRIGQ
jgi:hypothetical protein